MGKEEVGLDLRPGVRAAGARFNRFGIVTTWIDGNGQRVYFDDLTDASERIWDVLENFKEIAEALESSNESVLSHRLNDSLRILTAASVVLLPLTLIASVWGMNVPVPGEGAPGAFWFIIVVMAILLIGMVLYFRRRGWL